VPASFNRARPRGDAPPLPRPGGLLHGARRPPPADVQEIGPGQYSSDTKTFKLSELDVSAGVISREHGVALTGGDLARPQSAPATRPELGVFGPGWQAEFVGGEINRKLENQNGDIVVTELEEGTSTRYVLKSMSDPPVVKLPPDGAGDLLKRRTLADGREEALVSWTEITPGPRGGLVPREDWLPLERVHFLPNVDYGAVEQFTEDVPPCCQLARPTPRAAPSSSRPSVNTVVICISRR
jgi:hypothetical protein